MNTTSFGGVRITLFGHASVSFEFGGKIIHVDPFVLGRGARAADVILHTHNHHDHCASAPSITTPNTLIIGKGCKHPGRPAEIGEKLSAAGVTIEVVDAYNPAKSFHPKDFGAGYVLTFPHSAVPGRSIPTAGASATSGASLSGASVAGRPIPNAPVSLHSSSAARPVRIYVAGDTDVIPEMAHIQCDVALLPIGGTYTMNEAEAAQAVAILKPKIVIPYHYNYLDETKADPLAFKRAVEALGLGIDVRILTP